MVMLVILICGDFVVVYVNRDTIFERVWLNYENYGNCLEIMGKIMMMVAIRKMIYLGLEFNWEYRIAGILVITPFDFEQRNNHWWYANWWLCPFLQWRLKVCVDPSKGLEWGKLLCT